MRWWVVVLLAGCVKPTNAFVCADSTQCSGGVCETTGYCSFADPACGGGQRYGNTAGDGLAGTCVGGGDPVDGSTDSTVTAVCGNHMIEPGEDCDDGNTDDGDACNSICLDCSGNAEVVSNGHCYFRIDTPAVDKATAQVECTNRGGHLVTYESAAENTIGATLIVGGVGNSFWIGMDIAANGVQTWVDGTPDGFDNFAVGEPDDAANSRCVDQARTSGLWGDEVCSRLHGYVCERERP